MRPRFSYRVMRIAALAVIVIALLAPLAWMVAASLKTNVDIYDSSKAFIFSPTLENYTNVLRRADYIQFVVNSLWVAFAATVISLILGVPAAYSMSRFKMKRSAIVVFTS